MVIPKHPSDGLVTSESEVKSCYNVITHFMTMKPSDGTALCHSISSPFTGIFVQFFFKITGIFMHFFKKIIGIFVQ